jgi:hypothetical protein
MATEGFWETLDRIDRSLSQVSIEVNLNHPPTVQSIAHLLTACRALQAIVQQQYEHIVDLNSRVEYGYTHKEAR